MNDASRHPRLSAVELYNTYSAMCLRVAGRTISDHHRAQDVVQDAFLSFFEHPERYDAERASLAGWLATLTHRRAVDLIRRERVRPQVSAFSEGVLAQKRTDCRGPEERAVAADSARRVQVGVLTLSPAKQQIIFLNFNLGYSQSEIARVTGMPLGTVKSRHREALRELKLLINDSRT